jgi:hypothetical protein
VLLQDVQRGAVLWDAEHVVVSDDGDAVALYVCPGAPRRWPRDIRDDAGRLAQNLLAQRWTLTADVWEDNHVLRLLDRRQSHSVELLWADATWAFRGWYVNLQDPLRRTPSGFETTDYALDIVVAPDRTWSWKDEADLEDMVAVGYLTHEQAANARAEGERVIERIESWRAPFSDGWEAWRPRTEWITELRSRGQAGAAAPAAHS